MSSAYPVSGDPSSMTRKDLQMALKACDLPSGGTNDQLRQRYALLRQSRGIGNVIDVIEEKSSVRAATKAAATKSVATAKKKPETRLKRYRKSCPIAVQQRIDRARTQRMFLITKDDDANMETLTCNFVVLGSTGNVYNVAIQRVPHCTCPDHARGNLCKHILFVLLKVMALPPHSSLVYQAAWTENELTEMFQGMRERYRHVSGSVLANSAVRDGYAKLSRGENLDDKVPPDSAGVARRTDEEDCPICFDALGSEANTTYCRAQCGANFHQGCIRHWLQQHRTKPTCPMCRGPWEQGESPGGKRKAPSEGYTNLGRFSGQSPDRDTSTYHSLGEYNKRRRNVR